MDRRAGVLLTFLTVLILGLTFTAGSVVGSNLAQSLLQPYPHIPLAQAAGRDVAPSPSSEPTMFGLEVGTILLGGVVLILLILLSLVLMSKDGSWTPSSHRRAV